MDEIWNLKGLNRHASQPSPLSGSLNQVSFTSSAKRHIFGLHFDCENFSNHRKELSRRVRVRVRVRERGRGRGRENTVFFQKDLRCFTAT